MRRDWLVISETDCDPPEVVCSFPEDVWRDHLVGWELLPCRAVSMDESLDEPLSEDDEEEE